jgi:hypothetical protein
LKKFSLVCCNAALDAAPQLYTTFSNAHTGAACPTATLSFDKAQDKLAQVDNHSYSALFITRTSILNSFSIRYIGDCRVQ